MRAGSKSKQRKKVSAPKPKHSLTGRHRTEKQIAREALRRKHKQELARLERTFQEREKRAKYARKNFRPRKADRGTIVFVGSRGGRLPKNSSRRGYAVYIDRKGRKSLVRQFSKDTGRLEKTPVARKLTAVDVGRVRSKRARKQFLEARLNPVARAALTKTKKGISSRGTRWSDKIETNQFYEKADSVQIIAKELVKAINSLRSKKDLLVTIGISVRDANNRFHWVQLERRFSRRDGQKADVSEAVSFLGREIYSFLAKELADRNLVLSGSARHIGRLKENRGKSRDEWTKDGFLWQGHDMNNVTIDRVEYRFDQLTLTK